MSKKNVVSLLAISLTAVSLFTVSGYSAASSEIENPYGTAVNGTQVDRVIHIDAATRSVQVTRFETVRFEFANGTPSVQWYFDTLGTPVIKLKQIASVQAANQKVKIYVNDAQNDQG